MATASVSMPLPIAILSKWANKSGSRLHVSQQHLLKEVLMRPGSLHGRDAAFVQDFKD